MSFKNIKGQDSAVDILRGSISNERVGHAYIFLGPNGVGKRLAAVNFAKALNCIAPKENEPCDECISCKKIDGSNHPDVSFIRPEEDASSIKIDAVRGIIKDVNLKPYEGKKKVYIIERADSMKHEAANALLKTLEAPVSDSVMILLTQNLKALFPTIVSRSQVVRFFPLSVDEVRNILIRDHSIDADKALVLSHLSSGRLGEALEYRTKGIFEKRERIIDALLKRSLFDIDIEKISRDEIRIYLDIMLSWYRDILAAKTGAPADMLINTDKKESIKREAASLAMDHIYSVMDQIMLTGLYLDQNANMKLAMGVLAGRIAA